MAKTRARHRKAARPITPMTDMWNVVKQLDSTKQLSAVAGSGLALSVIAAGTVVPQDGGEVAAAETLDTSKVVRSASESLTQNDSVSTQAALATEEVSVKKLQNVVNVSGVAIENPGSEGARIRVRPWESITPQGDLSNPVVAIAVKYLNRPYVWGASGPDSFDCSGYVSFVYRQLGYNLPHSSAAYASMDGQVPMSDLRPGDILWRPGHVGLYIGDGKVAHSNSPGGGTVIARLGQWGGSFTGAVRIIK